MKDQIEKKACKNCIHYQMCVDTFRKAKQDGEILLIEEEAYFANANGCDFYADKRIYRKQSEGEWEWFEEWNPSTPEHPRECDDCGWRCGECKTALADIVGGYWDDPDEKPNLNFCPNCGAKMKGGAE